MSDLADAGTPLLPECEFDDDIPRDAQGCLPVGALAAARDCRISHGECFTLTNPEHAFGTKKEKTRMAKTPKHAPAAAPAPAPAPTPEETAEVAPAEAAADEGALDEEQAAPLPGPPRAPMAPQAHAEVPAPHTAVGELSSLLPKDGSGGSAITVMLALIAVAGGGAGWKFYQSFAKQKHEQRMKELEIKEKRVELQAEKVEEKKDDHKACEAARAADRAALEQARVADRAALEEKLAALEARLAEAEKGDDIDLPFDPEELNERIEQIEKALKKAPSEKKPSDKKAKKDAKKDA
jgi:hypothetical protein